MKLKSWGGGNQWDTPIPHDLLLKECNRVLKVSGRLILFSQEPYTNKMITNTLKNIPFNYKLVWVKDTCAIPLSAKKAPLNYYEDICVFTKKYDDLFLHPLREYAEKVLNLIGKTKSEIMKDLGHYKLAHFLGHIAIQFSIPTESAYNEMVSYYNLKGLKSYREVEKIHAAYKNYPIFNLPEGKKARSNVMEFRKDYTGMHPTQKPILLLEELIKTYSNEGDTVLDFTCGSGSTLVACQNLGRNGVGIDNGFCESAKVINEIPLKGLSWIELTQLRLDGNFDKPNIKA